MSDVSRASYSDPGTHNSSLFSNTQIPLICSHLWSQATVTLASGQHLLNLFIHGFYITCKNGRFCLKVEERRPLSTAGRSFHSPCLIAAIDKLLNREDMKSIFFFLVFFLVCCCCQRRRRTESIVGWKCCLRIRCWLKYCAKHLLLISNCKNLHSDHERVVFDYEEADTKRWLVWRPVSMIEKLPNLILFLK